MLRTLAVTIAVGLTVALPDAARRGEQTKTVTWTGWFSDAGCARVKDGAVGPNNTECVRRCLHEGAKPVFISEQAKAIFEVKDYPAVKEEVGYRVELIGSIDESAETISVKSVKRLSEVVAICMLPKK